jgi:hypothetical protein
MVNTMVSHVQGAQKATTAGSDLQEAGLSALENGVEVEAPHNA